MNPALLSRLFDRPADANKYDFGHVLIVGGSPGMVGAPLLAAMGALRVGAGLATVASQADVVDKLEKRVAEVMTLRLPAGADAAVHALQTFVHEHHVRALAIGPGLDRSHVPLVTAVVQQLAVPAVVDGGALAAFSADAAAVQPAALGGIVLTPHAGEFARLAGQQPPKDRAQLKRVVAQYAKAHNVVLVFKGRHTLVASPAHALYENATGNPGLATAGTGDVLAGVIAGLLAQRFAPVDAATLGVYLHGLAADMAVRTTTQAGLVASDVLSALPAALQAALVGNPATMKA